MSKLDLSYNEFQELQLNLKLIDYEINWINSLNDNDRNIFEKRKGRLEITREAIMERIDKSIKKTEPQQSPKIPLPDFLKDGSKAELVYFLYRKWTKLANENNDEYKEYYQVFVEKENDLSGQERAEFEKLRYNDWVKDFFER